MAQDLREVKDIESLMAYFSEKLGWAIDPDDYYDIDDITYDFEATDLGLKEEAFAKITSLKQLRPLVDNQRWGIFFVNFESNRFEVSALRKILSGLIPSRRNADHAVWDKKDLLFLCTWGERNKVTIGAAYFEDSEKGLPQIKMISCEPSVEDFTQINVFEQRLAKLAWPSNPSDTETWHEAWASAFTTRYRQTIRDAHTLTVRLAAEAQNIRDRILNTLEIETSNGYVHLLFQKFKDTLVHDMTEQQFADMYAQTIVYGLFSARCMDDSQEDFNAAEAVECIPNTNPFLKGLLQECLGSTTSRSKLSFDELEVGNIVDLLLHTQTDSIIRDFNRQTGGGREDPVIHFYEEFLSEYDKTQRVQRGVYYTPQPVVNFIVRAVDDILKQEFGVEDGLASTTTKKIKYLRQSKKRVDGYYHNNVVDEMDVPAIQVLDPATGTGTFLRQAILQIYGNFCSTRKGMTKEHIQVEWNRYVPEQLLPRLNGFELMMAPYAVAHMKLAMVLKDTGYDFNKDERLQVYLTNTLEEPGNSETQLTLFEDPLTLESVSANVVKKNSGINVILGNPPYSGISSNSGKWITNMIEDYKYINGEYFNERKHWLQDDYVKFIRLSEHFLETRERGILAFINNHAFLSNPTFRCMRYHLLQTFDEVYIINLHGNSLIGEKTPDGSKDVNVFDIQQGVSINIFIKRNVKKSKSLATVYYADLYGEREFKYDWLLKNRMNSIQWNILNPIEPYYFFVEMALDNTSSYNSGFAVQELFIENVMGITTARDFLVIDMDKDVLLSRIQHFCDPKLSDDAIRNEFFPGKSSGKYLPGDTRGWQLSSARKKIANNNHADFIRPICYRPFDTRYIYYCHEMVDWDREKVMKHFISGKNYGLSLIRISRDDRCAVLVTDNITDKTVISSKDNANVFPLYLYDTDNFVAERKVNFNFSIVEKIAATLGIPFKDTDIDDGQSYFTALNLLDYIYGILHNESYTKKYADLLKAEFPRIPYPKSKRKFWKTVECGSKLRAVHLMQSSEIDGHQYPFKGIGDNILKKATFKNGAIYINETQYFDNVSEELWNEYVGAYQPLQKWTKDRKGMILTNGQIFHFQKIIASLEYSRRIKQELNRIWLFE